MARHYKRPDDYWLKPDPRFQDKILSKFTNCVMMGGEKATAQRVVYGALDAIQTRLDKDKVETMPRTAIELFHLALENVRPAVEVRSKRVGGANYQVPMQLNRRRQQSLAFRWVIDAARDEKGRPMHLRLAKELWDAAKNEGKAVTTKENTHRMADANKAFAHFAW
ncbi:MAG: 30S ribosomal protein S7 [Planctomycetota bacterium]|jgi:small subunit ribosomal protein S7|nr:MAG: 30S ribosomal protein S7 [Planctomycetota bacterium]RLS95824.1 MAG: 30S ribosomal protein S7 [Planctomycetota bacterium]